MIPLKIMVGQLTGQPIAFYAVAKLVGDVPQ